MLELNLALDRLAGRRELMSARCQPRTSARRSRCSSASIVRRALLDSIKKLDPRVQMHNPVMFVVEIGSLITTVTWLIQVFGGKPLGGGNDPPGTRS